MSIIDKNGNDIIRLSTLWAWAFKLLLSMTPVVILLLWTWGVWITNEVFEHRSDLQRLKDKAGVATAPLKTMHALDQASLNPPRPRASDHDNEPANTCP
jgi:hypothetical protein